jgi:hypothetical protein
MNIVALPPEILYQIFDNLIAQPDNSGGGIRSISTLTLVSKIWKEVAYQCAKIHPEELSHFLHINLKFEEDDHQQNSKKTKLQAYNFISVFGRSLIKIKRTGTSLRTLKVISFHCQFLTSLQFSPLSNKKITQVFNQLKKLPHLKSLFLEVPFTLCNSSNFHAVPFIPDGSILEKIVELDNLKKLACRIKEVKPPHLLYLNKMKNLSFLELKIASAAFQMDLNTSLVEVINSLVNLKFLKLSYDNRKNPLNEEFSQTLSQSKSLKTFMISDITHMIEESLEKLEKNFKFKKTHKKPLSVIGYCEFESKRTF